MPPRPIDGEEIRRTIKAWFEASFGQVPYEIRLDIGDARTYYQGIDPEQVQSILKNEPRVERSLYRRGHFDCEDFAIAARAAVTHATLAQGADRYLSPPAFGLLFANSHATNIGVDPEGKPFLLDWYYKVLWQGDTLEGALQQEIGRGWCSPRSVRYILI